MAVNKIVDYASLEEGLKEVYKDINKKIPSTPLGFGQGFNANGVSFGIGKANEISFGLSNPNSELYVNYGAGEGFFVPDIIRFCSGPNSFARLNAGEYYVNGINRVYHPQNKPTAGDLGVIPVKNGKANKLTHTSSNSFKYVPDILSEAGFSGVDPIYWYKITLTEGFNSCMFSFKGIIRSYGRASDIEFMLTAYPYRTGKSWHNYRAIASGYDLKNLKILLSKDEAENPVIFIGNPVKGFDYSNLMITNSLEAGNLQYKIEKIVSIDTQQNIMAEVPIAKNLNNGQKTKTIWSGAAASVNTNIIVNTSIAEFDFIVICGGWSGAGAQTPNIFTPDMIKQHNIECRAGNRLYSIRYINDTTLRINDAWQGDINSDKIFKIYGVWF